MYPTVPHVTTLVYSLLFPMGEVKKIHLSQDVICSVQIYYCKTVQDFIGAAVDECIQKAAEKMKACHHYATNGEINKCEKYKIINIVCDQQKLTLGLGEGHIYLYVCVCV